MPSETIWTLAAFFLTVLVLSYVLGDNPLFRIATYLFVGVSAGYIAVLIIYQVLVAKLFNPFIAGSLQQKLLIVIPFVLGLLLIFKLFPRLAAVGNVSMGFLVGVGAAVAIGGAITGTLLASSPAVYFCLVVRLPLWLIFISERAAAQNRPPLVPA